MLLRVAAMLTALLGQAVHAAQMMPSVRVAPAEQRALAPSMWVPGTVVSRNDAWLSVEVEGRLTMVAEVGTAVAKGDALVRIDAYPLELALADSQANVKRLQASLTFNEKQLERLQELARSNSASRTQRDEVQAQREMVRQELARARVAVQQREYALQRAVLAAPFAGRVVDRGKSEGEYARAGEQVLRLVNVARKEIRANAPMRVAPYIDADSAMSVRLHVNGTEAGQAQGISSHPLRAVVPVGDELSRSLELRIPVAADELLVGSAVRVAVPTGERQQHLAVPRDAVFLRSGGSHVVRVQEGAIAILPVTVLAVEGDWVGVSGGGLTGGDQVVIRGGERLRPGQQVQVLP